jgi:hypothetical protein
MPNIESVPISARLRITYPDRLPTCNLSEVRHNVTIEQLLLVNSALHELTGINIRDMLHISETELRVART